MSSVGTTAARITRCLSLLRLRRAVRQSFIQLVDSEVLRLSYYSRTFFLTEFGMEIVSVTSSALARGLGKANDSGMFFSR